MIDWLRSERLNPSVTIAGRQLPISIRRHARARRLTMRLAPDGAEIRITLPTWGRTMDALVFAQNRTDWLEQQLARVPQATPVEPGGSVFYRGQELRIDWHAAHPRRPVLTGTGLRCGGPADRLERRIRSFLEQEALQLCAADLADYCALARQPVPALRLSRARRRWGSCSGSARGSGEDARCIRINWRLVMAPDHVRRSVVAHEVAHLAHFDHSPAFHKALAGLYEGDLRAADRWLKERGRSLYAAFG